MSTQTFLVDPASTTVTLRTGADGLLARFAHSLQIVGREVSGKATRDGDTWTAELSVPVAALRVEGALHGDVLDPGALSASEREQIEQKMREDVFFGGARVIAASVQGASPSSGEATIALGQRTQRVPVVVSLAETAPGALTASGRFTLSLEKLGVRPIKGPLGAFRVKDAVEVRFNIALAL